MNSEAVPVIRLEVANLKHAIMHHMGIAGSDLSEAIGEKVDKAVADYPWDETVKKVVDESIRSALSRYFTYGEGYKAIEGAIDAALDQMNAA